MRRHFVRKFVFDPSPLPRVVSHARRALRRCPLGSRRSGSTAGKVGIVLIALAIFLIVRAGRRFASPFGDVMEAADRVAAGDYETRVQERGSREVRRLGRAFNEMTERLGTNETRRRQLLADVAHELRTPLSVIQANLEAILDGLYPIDEAHLRPVLEETNVMARLLDDLQTLSTAEAGVLTLHREPVEPRQLIDAAVGCVHGPGQGKPASASRCGAPRLPEIDVDRLRIGEVLSNLLSNALRHTPSGGEVDRRRPSHAGSRRVLDRR